MGFNGDIVVLRSATPLDQLAAHVDEPEHEKRSDFSTTGDWQVVHIRHFAAPYELERPWLENLAAATGAPVMTCNVFESDYAFVRGLSRDGYWTVWLDPVSGANRMAELWQTRTLNETAAAGGDIDEVYLGPDDYRAMVDENLRELERTRPQTAAQIVAWSAAAGFEVAAADVIPCLARTRDPFVQILFFDLLELIGILPPDER